MCWTKYADFYRASPYSAFPQEHKDSKGRLPFHMLTVDQNDHEFSDPAVPEVVLALPLSAEEGNRWSWDFGNGWHRDCAAPGRVLVLPPDMSSQWEVRGHRKLLVLTVASRTVKQILGPSVPEDISDALIPLTDRTHEDPLIKPLMLRLWESLAGTHATDRLLVDSALVTLIAHLIQRAGCEQKAPKFVALPPWRLKRVREYVEAHLHEEVDIVTLSEVAGLSVRHFSRAFREEMGETPHKWLMARRTEKAMELMANPNMGLSQVAELCGFAGQSHFTTVFKRVTGHTPKRWSNERRRG
ncbi:AraC family transcriptional regulator [Paraburkholderia tropica]|nr:AraC family transcriptional regulator [Paraburkholderia tropica]